MLKPARRMRQRGLTMIEIATALVIMSVATFLTVPDILSAMSNARIRSSAEAMLSGLQRARMDAMRNNLPVTFWMMSHNADRSLDNGCAQASTSLSFVVSGGDPSGQCLAAAADTGTPAIRFRHSAGDAARSILANGTAADRAAAATSVTFNGYGRVQGDGLRFIDIDSTNPSNDSRALRIEMTTSGVIRLCEPNLPAGGTDPRRCLYS